MEGPYSFQDVVNMDLWDTSGRADVSVAEALILEGLAVFSGESSSQVEAEDRITFASHGEITRIANQKVDCMTNICLDTESSQRPECVHVNASKSDIRRDNPNQEIIYQEKDEFQSKSWMLHGNVNVTSGSEVFMNEALIAKGNDSEKYQDDNLH